MFNCDDLRQKIPGPGVCDGLFRVVTAFVTAITLVKWFTINKCDGVTAKNPWRGAGKCQMLNAKVMKNYLKVRGSAPGQAQACSGEAKRRRNRT